jgi:hypothetical protein
MKLKNVYLLFLLLIAFCGAALAQSTLGTIQGTVTDNSGAVVTNATVTVTNTNTNFSRSVTTDATGNYSLAQLPLGPYRIEVQSSGMGKQLVNNLVLEVGRTVNQNFSLKPAQVEQTIEITGEAPVIESTTMAVGQVMDPKNVQEIPLNGRHFVDLGFLVAGSVTPPSNGFLAQPIRGQGSLAFNTAGQREDAVNFMVNGINLADMGNGQITFQPAIATLDEFKVDNSTYSAESGRNSGAVVNMATRSGTNAFHGEVFDFMRNNYFDARNFFNKDTVPQSQFIRNDFGGDIGGPIIKNKLFFFGGFEGLRQRQGITVTPTVLTAAQRAAALASPNATIRQLVPLIPVANDSTGSKFLGSASAPVVLDQYNGDISYNVSQNDRIHGYYTLQRDIRTEPTDANAGSTVPGFGDQRVARRQLFTFAESHVFSGNLVNEFRLGFNRIHILFDPINKLDPTSFGINDGRSGPVGLPEIFVQSAGLDFGGVSGFPQGRADLTTVLSDTVSYQHGRHNFKFGGEGRQVNNNGTFSHDIGFVQFNNFTDFINGNISAFTNGGDVGPHLIMRALDLFAQDNYKVKPYITLELGVRYEWNMSPFEKDNRWSEFLPATASLVQIGTSALPLIYSQNNKDFEPRLGFAWDLFHNGKTVLRSGYGWAVDQPLPNPGLTSNPPFVSTLRFSASGTKPFTSFSTLVTDAAASGAAIGTTDHNFKDAYVQSYNLNLQQQITGSTGIMIGYFGSKGTHLRQNINLNQPFYTNASTGAQSQPFPNVSPSSPLSPGAKLGTSMTDRVSNGNSNYNALWATATRRLAKGLQFSANYTWSKSLDYASQTGSAVPENSLNVRGDYGPSDFDARHRFTFSGVYELPLKGNRLVDGWRLSGILQLQSGNPLSLLAGAPISATGIPAGSSSVFTGVATNRPDLIAAPVIVNQIITSGPQAGNVQWMAANSVCDPRFAPGTTNCPSGATYALPVALVGGANIYHFGNMRRNSILGPNFKDLDMSLTKTTRITERLRAEFRVEAFDLANHPNFGNPNRTAVTSAGNTFGVITSTRFPNGDSGSARQLQFAMKLIF